MFVYSFLIKMVIDLSYICGLFMPLLDRTVVESRQESIGWRDGSAKDLETGIELGSP